MKVSELFEMPQYINKEMPILGDFNLFYSEESIERLFDKVSIFKVGEDEFAVLIKKSRADAVLGKFSFRDNETFGVSVIGKLEFKDTLDLSWINEIHVSAKNVLQVDGVSLNAEVRSGGLGTHFYVALVKYGFVLISDTLQYTGGRKLWDKLARTSKSNSVNVFIVADGEVVMDGDNPLKYNGKNYSEDEIWGPETNNPSNSKKHVLLVLKKG